MTPDLRLSIYQKINVCGLSHTVCGNLFWKPKKTNTSPSEGNPPILGFPLTRVHLRCVGTASSPGGGTPTTLGPRARSGGRCTG